MSVLYESCCVLTRRRLAEMTRKGRSPAVSIVPAALLVVAWAAVLLGGLYAKTAAGLWIITACVVVCVLMPEINGVLQYYRFHKLYGEPVKVVVRLYGDRLENYTPVDGGTLKLTYDQLRKIYEGRHAIYLRLDKGFFLLLDPERFTVGNAQDALAFLREKMDTEKD